jgi:hypothetical protein
MNLIGERWTGTYITLVHLQARHVNVQTQETFQPKKEQTISFYTIKETFSGSRVKIRFVKEKGL